MSKELEIKKDKNEIIKILQKSVQSCNLNFLIGSGCSFPAISVLGNIEQEVEGVYKSGNDDKATEILTNFLQPFVENNNLIQQKSLVEILRHESSTSDKNADDKLTTTIRNYYNFIAGISRILFERKSNILHKQASIFSTNYDMFIEKTFEIFSESIVLNDGFLRGPSLSNRYIFSTRHFYSKIFNTGNLYKYQVELPSINLIKLHGSLNWKIDQNDIVESFDHLEQIVDKEPDSLESMVIVLPRKMKFSETVLNQNYYEMLRIFSNELDKENTILISEGFSFADEHICDIVKRALKNPTLRLLIFCFKKEELPEYKEIFSAFENVNIVYSEDTKIDFKVFTETIVDILPQKEEPPIYKVLLEEKEDA